MESWDNRKLDGFVTKTAQSCCGVTVAPGEGCAVVQAAPGMDRKRYQRQYSIVRGYAVLALGRAPEPGEAAELSPGALPLQEGADAAAAVWFARACESTDTAAAVIAVYQGFRSLSGGAELAEQYLPPALAARFPEWVKAARMDENDLGEASAEPSGRQFWAQADPGALCRALRQACRDAGAPRGEASHE